MSRCSWKCFACAVEDRAECWAQVQEHAAICTCHAGPLLFTDLDLLDPPPLAFPYKEALYEDDQSSRALEEECGREFGSVHEPEFPDKVRFIQDFLHHANLPFDLTGKDVMWSWGPLEQTALDTLKHAMTSRPVSLFPDDNSPFWVEADSSNFATGAVLLQQSSEDGKWHLVAFYFKSLNVVEQNYEIHDKKMLAIIWLFEEWWHFLEGVWHKFKIWTDHKNLKYFWTAKKLNCQQAWWSLYLANFDFSLCYKPGQSMRKPDTLSQRVDHGMGEEDNSNIVLLCSELFVIQAMEGLAVKGVEVDILWDIQWGNWNGQQEELVVQAA
ncbi:hypothetical protein E4T56_gene11906 [Termitomyces sp. T112]|nr:hypothetical protein E4T56_gene11906 [Termitomyces sp. T112]